jgi:predicted Ser/Thr protein kinase
VQTTDDEGAVTMQERRAPDVGDVLGGYTLESVLGRGGMGTVYLATHERLGRRVALKIIAPELAHDDDFRVRFLREAKLAASLDHPHVIPVYDAGEIDGVLFIAMRYVRGSTLQQILRDAGPLSTAETLRITEQVGGALDAAHAAGLVHRDVKPANVLLAEPDGHVYLGDFGLAKRMSSDSTTRTGFFLGTADYSAPEQIEGRSLDARADVYSLGGVVFHCLTGRPPFTRDTEFAVLQAHLGDAPPPLSELRPELPPELDRVVATALAKSPDARYASAGSFARALRDAMTADADAMTKAAPAVVPGETAPTRPFAAEAPATSRPQSRRRLLPWVAVGVAAAAVLVAVIAAVVVTRDSGGGSGSDVQTAEIRAFLDRMENVLDQSAAGRREIRDALSAARDCSIRPSEAARRIASVADNRQSILEQLGALPTPTPETATLVTLLQRALQESIEADRHYRDGFLALGNAATCPLPGNRDFDLAAQVDRQATAAKARFAKAFNGLARRDGKPTWSPDDF